MRFKPAADVVQFDVAETSDDRFDMVIEGILVAALAFCPIAIGGVQAWSQGVFLALCAATAGGLALKLVFRADVRFVWSWAYVPMALFVLLAVVQLLPLPAEWVRAVSPRTFERKTELLADMPGAAERLKWMKLTFDPNASLRDLRLLLGVCAVFVVTVNVVRRFAQIRKLIIAMTVIGGVLGLVALAQNLFGSGHIYGVVRTFTGRANAGPFINQNHGAQFFNLTLGAGLALLLMTIHRLFRREDYSFEEVVEKLKSEHMLWGWVGAGTVILSAAAVALTLSRGGIGSMLIAGALAGLLAAKAGRFSARGWVVSILGLIVTLLVIYVGADALFDRFATIADRRFADVRRQILVDSTSIWAQYRFLGTGLGAHQVVFPAFSHLETSAVYTHAENEYAQVLTEMGVVGLLLVGLFLIVMAGNFIGAVRGAASSASSMAIGLGFSVTAVLVQSTTDFAPHFPAVAVWLAVSFALISNLAESRRRERKGSVEELPSRGHLWMRVVGTAAVAGASAWTLGYAYHAYRAEEAFWPARVMEVRLAANGWRGSPEEYDVLLSAAEEAVEAQPSNVEYGYWLNMYRWRAITQDVDPATGDFKLTREDLNAAGLIVEGFRRLRWFAPTFGPAYAMAGQVEHFVLGRKESGAREIRLGYALAPDDGNANYAFAVLAAVEERWEESRKMLERAIRLDGSLREVVVDRLVRTLDRPDVAFDLVGDDRNALRMLARLVNESGKSPEFVETIDARLLELLRQDVAGPKPTVGSLVELARHYGRLKDPAAVALYQRALTLEYGDVGIRYELARALEAHGDIAGALQQVKLILQQRPKFVEADSLQYELINRMKQIERERETTRPTTAESKTQ